ncbi:probable LRR receptor-like serine/threonine-protein kinase At4g20940 [Selaginella moellendorffii]|uniref:probable LRR receptor-like serine/threonine-protein kinase At4g20940 n=1 Tax=Selaginella moellendorffii TaxID=88036 RepID=UPI000D1D100B|nr:probable LRR receptor-like serine/threonine-protein kinase At4g20940 [Selaginella moellendorffii]|eukprot:XP_024531182.1 probable LRR receptor-like serine/threonine-protein kinase At4g20940 [Selaginella moellendorffii]
MGRIMLVLVVGILVLSSSWRADSLADDASALLKFRDGVTGDPGGLIRSSWVANRVDPSGCPSQWHGVVCSNGSVTGLALGDLQLQGEISPGTIGRLSRLTSLLLGNNSLGGKLPEDLGELHALQFLDLSANQFVGSIPSSFAGLRSVVNFSLSSNKLEGPVPDMFASMIRLGDLDLSGNSLSGGIPPSITSLRQLVSLNLSWNAFSGVIPREMSSLESLHRLDLRQNRLSGEVDPVLMGLSRMEVIDMSCNELSGLLPWQQGAPFVFPQGISSVNLSSNRFTGELAPENAASLFASELQILDVSSNLLSGKLPSFSFVFSLRVLKLQNNSFVGYVPPALLATESVLEELDISFNNLSGTIGMVAATSLSILRLASNNFSGTLPIRLGSCAIVDFSNNHFSGNLDVMKDWRDSLQVLDLSGNSFDGVLSNETAHLLRLMYLNVSHNALSGPIPGTLASLRKLTALDLSSNNLDGEIPGDFFHSPSLTIFRVANNNLVGGIPVVSFLSSSAIPGELLSPTSISSTPPAVLFSPLQVLDLSFNSLNGSIPQEIASLSGLVVLNLGGNDFTGGIPSQLSRLRYLENLDLSSNHLRGRIPAQLPSSLQTLNLTNNDLSGHLPANLLSRFPLSSFFPGNAGLVVPGSSGAGIPSLRSRRGKGLSSAVKAGLIGGCVAATVIIIAIALFVYSRLQAADKNSSDERDVVKSPHRLEFGPPSAAKAGASVSLSREQLLPQQGNVPGSPEQGDGRDTKKKQEGLLTRKRSKSRTTLLDEGPSSLERAPSQKVRSPDKLAGDLFLLDSSIVFTPEELSSAPAEVLGRSSHGTSYKATLENGHMLAVKWLREGLAKNKAAFTREARKFGSIQHPNILPLRGYYWGPREHEKLVISDYLSFGSLSDRLTERSGRRFPPLEWSQRVRIAVDITRGLSYLHTKHKLPHGNLKASNVLLDGSSLVARLSDYSIHRLMTPAGTANQILNAGALGYRAPELAHARKPKPTLKADIYAFGVILMEIVTGKGAGDIISGNSGAVDLTDWVKLLVSEGRGPECYDQALVGYDRDQEPPQGIDDVLALALSCILERSERPSIKVVQEDLRAACPEKN